MDKESRRKKYIGDKRGQEQKREWPGEHPSNVNTSRMRKHTALPKNTPKPHTSPCLLALLTHPQACTVHTSIYPHLPPPHISDILNSQGWNRRQRGLRQRFWCHGKEGLFWAFFRATLTRFVEGSRCDTDKGGWCRVRRETHHSARTASLNNI